MEKEKLIALVKGVQKGDESAMTQMYEAFYEEIYYYIFKNDILFLPCHNCSFGIK